MRATSHSLEPTLSPSVCSEHHCERTKAIYSQEKAYYWTQFSLLSVSPCKQAKVVNIRPLSLSFLPADTLWANHNVQVLAVTQSQQRQLSAPVNRQAGCSKVPAPTNLRCMSSWQQNNYFLRGSYCLRHAMNSVQVQCQFITLHYWRQLTSWVQLLKKREIISALIHLDSLPPPNKYSKGKKLWAIWNHRIPFY